MNTRRAVALCCSLTFAAAAPAAPVSLPGVWSNELPALYGGEVNVLATYDDGSGAGPRLIVGGSFTSTATDTPESGPVKYAAMWDGAKWRRLESSGAAINGTVEGFLVADLRDGRGERLYASGSGLVNNEALVRLDGDRWTPIDHWAFWMTPVGALNGRLFVSCGCSNPQAWPDDDGYISQFDGATNQWMSMGGGASSVVHAWLPARDHSKIYMTGSFPTVGSRTDRKQVRSVASWDGSSFSTVGTHHVGQGGVAGVGYALEFFDFGDGEHLTVSGQFSQSFGVEPPVRNLARYNPKSDALVGFGGGTNNAVNTIKAAPDGRTLYIGGTYTSVNIVPTGVTPIALNRLAAWSPARGWMTLGAAPGGSASDGVNGAIWPTACTVNTMLMFDLDGPGRRAPALIIGGHFTSAGGIPCTSIAVWQPGCPADIAADDATPLSSDPMRINSGVNEGDFNAFFMGFFDAAPHCDLANDDGTPLPPFGPNADNGGVNEGDFNCFFARFFDGCG